MAGEAKYPKREAFFAHRYCRLLVKTCAANIIGAEGCWLLTNIALLEDAKRYTGPVSFWNGQLFPLVGLSNEWALHRLRLKCVAARWLHYIPATRGRAALYWVTIPDEYLAIPDGPCDENPAELFPSASARETSTNIIPSGFPSASARESAGKALGKPQTFIPSPSLSKLTEVDHIEISSFEGALGRTLASASRLKPRSTAERRLLAIAGILSVSTFSENWLRDAVEATAHSDATNRFGYFRSCLREGAALFGLDFELLAKQTNVPKPFYKQWEALTNGDNGKP